MIITSLTISNIRSFGPETTISFKDGVNLFIGPNGSGKSTLMDILNGVLNHFLFHGVQLNESNPHGKSLITIDPQSPPASLITKNYPKHFKHQDKPQTIKIGLKVFKNDLDNIKVIKENVQLLNPDLSKYQFNIPTELKTALELPVSEDFLGKDAYYTITGEKIDDKSLQEPSPNTFEKLFLLYLRYFEYLKTLINRYNNEVNTDKQIPELQYTYFYYPAYRMHASLPTTVNINNQSYENIRTRSTQNKSSNQDSTDILYAFTKLCLQDHYIMVKNHKLRSQGDQDTLPALCKTQEYLEIQKLLSQFVKNYQFKLEYIKESIYELTHILDHCPILFEHLCSGEKEIINLILSIITFGLKNATIIFDEPELHLHPQLQKKLIELFEKFASGEQHLQFIISTHSPVLVNNKTLPLLNRIYKEHGESKIITYKEPETSAEDAELANIISYANNAKIFFADMVILVEGPSDEAIFSYLTEKLQKTPDQKKCSVEFLRVNGKEEFKKYMKFLKRFHIKAIVICDLDAISNSEFLKEYPDIGKIRSALAKKLTGNAGCLKSLCRSKKELKKKLQQQEIIAQRLLDIAIKLHANNSLTEEDFEFLREYIIPRMRKKEMYNLLKQIEYKSLFPDKSNIHNLSTFSEYFYSKANILILPEGEIENYFNCTKKSVIETFNIAKNAIDEMLSLDQTQKVPSNHKLAWLTDRIKEILGIEKK